MCKSFTIILLFFSFNSLNAQYILKNADSLITAGEFKKALKLYQEHIKKQPNDSLTLYKIGNAYQRIENYKEANEYYRLAIKNNFYPGFTYGKIANNYLALLNNEGFINTLDSLIKYNPSYFSSIKKNDKNSKFLNQDKVISKLQQMKLKTYPCLSKEKSRQFDFWIGEWEVYAAGRKVGENIITSANGGCAIHESYTTNGAYTGQSINFVDLEDNLWKQYWVGSSGDISNYKEIESKKGKLVFLAISKNNATVTWTKMTFTHNPEKDEVRQYIEGSSDKGITWNVSFDGLYKKK